MAEKHRIRVEKQCVSCGELFAARKQSVCCSRSCAGRLNTEKAFKHGELNPSWRGGIHLKGESNRNNTLKWRAKNPIKHRCHKATQSAIASGTVIRGLCAICGERKTDAHHSDYSRPLEIQWLCRIHHIAWHKENTAING